MKIMKLGIDAISFYIPHYYLDLADLARARGVDSDKYYVGFGDKRGEGCVVCHEHSNCEHYHCSKEEQCRQNEFFPFS